MYSNQDISDQSIIPIIFMVSMEPVICREQSEFVDLEESIKNVILFTKFDLALSINKSENSFYNIIFSVTPRNLHLPGLSRVITDKFDDYNSEKARKFIDFSLNIFHPFKRAILAFDGENPISVNEFSKIVNDWKLELKNINLEDKEE